MYITANSKVILMKICYRLHINTAVDSVILQHKH